MKNLKPSDEGVVCLLDEKGDMYGVIRKDMNTRKNIFYLCTEMSFEELKALFSK